MLRTLQRSVPTLTLVAALLCLPAIAYAQAGFDSPEGAARSGIDALSVGWSSLANGWMLLDMVIVLLMSLVLGAVIAYHPSTRSRLSSLGELEQPKTFLMYSMVAAVVALIVKVQPAMAFVIFGIGGLLRFRTMVGEAKDTGRVILVTVVGLCCGLKIFIVALPATVIGWLVIYVLEKQVAGIIVVGGVPEEKLREATVAYRVLISKSGCTIVGEQTKFIKRQFIFVVKAPTEFSREDLQTQFDRVEDSLRGKVDWERL
ncbi:MAG: hypothetical protein GY811_15595 [Myxococcales bacterium]|nr:hypothetical protein [Myxococcales bacterium]